MIAKKICLLGSFAVGKTSLVRQFVDSIFSEKYHTTIGVKIDKKSVSVSDTQLQLMIWDIEGRDEFSAFKDTYLRGAAGYLLVMDLTRPDSFDVAMDIQRNISEKVGAIPGIVLLNKSDLTSERRISNEDVQALRDEGWLVFETSAKTGENVELAFTRLAEKLLLPA